MSNSKNVRDVLLVAEANGTLLATVGSLADQDQEAIADLLANMQNSGEIDLPANCQSDELARLPSGSFFPLQGVFCESLPKFDCSATDSVRACIRIYEHPCNDGAAELVVQAMQSWFQESPRRLDEGLELLHDENVHPVLVKPILFAGGAYDAKKFAAHALSLSHREQPGVQRNALYVLGRIVQIEDKALVQQTIDRLNEVIDAANSADDLSSAVEAALNLFERLGSSVECEVEQLLVKACRNPTFALRRVLATNLRECLSSFSKAMQDSSFQVLESTNNDEMAIIAEVDRSLYACDLDQNREYVLRFLKGLLKSRENGVEVAQLRNFRHKLAHGPGELLGWYVVSLLISGDHGLCKSANGLLPDQESDERLDIDLAPFGLGPRWIPFLARKILGYCLLKRESASALLLSCLRGVTDEYRHALEQLILRFLFMNYLHAHEWFEQALTKGDHAKKSIERMSKEVRKYKDELSKLGTCSAFAPSENERRLERHRQVDFWRDVQKEAEQRSTFSTLVNKATILYGSGSIAYVYDSGSQIPRREVIPFESHEFKVEVPSMQFVDPVALEFTLYLLQTEIPPQ